MFGQVWTPREATKGPISIAMPDRDEPRTNPTERDANARLIAAAPELLEALEALANRVDPANKKRDLTITSFVAALKKARAAIAKAKGES